MSVTTEVGRLVTVLLHRPGAELSRLTPRNNDSLLFDGIPWVGRAQEEHDTFAAALRAHGVEVLYVSSLLAETLTLEAARAEVSAAVLADFRLGDVLREKVGSYLAALSPAELATTLVAGLSRAELGASRAADPPQPDLGLVHALMAPGDFVIDPLPNLLFTRDSSVWIGPQAAVTSLAMHARRRETTLTHAIYRHHPRFAGTTLLYEPSLEHLEGGDVLLLAPGVIAVGVGERTRPSGAERLAGRCFAAGLAHTVLVVPIAQERATMHLDTVCTMVDVDAVVMYPNIANTLRAWTLTPDSCTGPEPFLTAAAAAMGIDTLRVIDTGLDPVTAEREQWDDGNNTLAIAPRLCVAYERNVETNAQLERQGIEVIRIPGSELGSGRGGPRCMSAPIQRA
ncbi:arginine deiminase [Dactylosporangium sp. NPDC051541]|uniref:arginine deiminase n=1 Tax=Dactylosporangium sp. NPDC051541 TaxID=3363977 RepID=UPI003793860B